MIETVYLLYLAITLAITIWVAHTLSKNGIVFLEQCFGQNETLARSTNHLLVVGFYLVNIGYVAMALKEANIPTNLQGVLEVLSAKLGVVLLVLGAMHFFNLLVFSRMRKNATDEEATYGAPVR